MNFAIRNGQVIRKIKEMKTRAKIELIGIVTFLILIFLGAINQTIRHNDIFVLSVLVLGMILSLENMEQLREKE